MTPLNEDELDQMLAGMPAAELPERAERRVLAGYRAMRPRISFWRWLVRGEVRVPVPVLAGFVLLLAGGVLAFVGRSQPAPPGKEMTLDQFRPVDDLKIRVVRMHNENY